MRVVWKDSKTYRSYIYRGYTIEKHKGGWITNLPGDNGIHYTSDHAKNYIDKTLGGHGNKINAQRRSWGIKIIGKKDGDNSCA